MVFKEVFEEFLKSGPICVMLRAVMENVFAPVKLDAVFHTAAVEQYERELLFSTLVDLTALVVCRITPSMHAAYVRRRDDIPVSVTALYDKLSHVEPCTSRALVQHTAGEVNALIDRMKGCRTALLPGYRVRILDGNHLAGTQRRLGVLRGKGVAALPGQALALLDPQRMVIEDVIPCEDGHAQERSLLDQVLPLLRARDVLIDDRNFCTQAFLVGIARRKAKFITRQHSAMPCPTHGKCRYVGKSKTGRVYEQVATVRNPAGGQEIQVRRITVKLLKPTRDGDGEIHLLTNLPSKVGAVKVAQLYLNRWKLETAFQELTVHLRCELNTLGYPKAALFSFCVAVCCYNLLAAIKGALRGAHGEEAVDQVSNFYLTDEISGVYRGMMIALPPKQWEIFRTMSTQGLATTLLRWSRQVALKDYPKHPRGPKRTSRPRATSRHVSTARLLEEKHTNKQLATTRATP